MKKTLYLLATLLFMATAKGQTKTSVDTLQCHIIGFSAGLQAPLGGSNSMGYENVGMKDLYEGPYLNFGVEWDFLFRNGWMLSLDGDLWFGSKYNSNNLNLRTQRMGDVFNSNGRIMAWNGTDGVVSAYNRSLAVRPGIAKIIHILPNDPNSGLIIKLSGGWFMQKTVFTQDMSESVVYQLEDGYRELYDHLRNGAILTESIGFTYMSNYRTYINVKVAFEFSQCLSWSSRPYIIDNLAGLNGKDRSCYLDLMFGVKLSWLFPITGRTSYDYYYY